MSGCPRCSTPVIAGARFCATCGADVSRLAGTVAVTTVTGPPSPPQRNALLEMLREATLGEYEVLGELGRGGMATVYLAHDIALDRKVAIKVISPSLLAGEGMVERFKREARTAASLSHPHIIPIYAVKETDRILYFVMKFVDGRPLDSIIREVGALPIPMAQAILHQAGGALAYAHRRGVVHRDVKPANIMVDEEGWAVVTDFGIAKISAAQALTMTGVTVGTPAYMSPEQCAAHPVTGASDQYSLAVVVYEMLTGHPPFAAESIMALMFAHFNEPVPPIKDGRPDCPPQLEAAVMRMLEKAPTHRWQDIEEAIAAAGGASLAQDESTRRSMTELARAGGTTEVLRRFSTPASPIPSMKASSVGAGRTMALLVSVSVSPSAKTLRVGQSVPLVATVRDANGVAHPERPVSWASNAPGVATVSPGGLLSAVAPGSAIITATSEGVSGTTAVTAVAPPSRSVAAEAVPHADARPKPRVPMTVWAVAATLVVGAAGLWAVLHRGGGGTDTGSVQGETGLVAALAVSPAADSLVVGGRLQLGAVARDAQGAVLGDRPVKWASSQPSIASVSPTGLVTGAAPGVATITASSEGRSASASVTVRAAVGSVTLTPADTSLKAGEIILVQVAIRDAAGNALRGRPVRWSSSDDRVATVNALGLVTAVGAGRATITGASEGRSAGASVAVTPGPVQPGPPAAVATVTVVPNELSLVVGESAQLSAALRDARGAPLMGRSITWTAADPRIATVATNGTVTAVGDGTTRITAGSERKNATAIITVSAPVPPRAAPVASIDVTPDPGTLRVGETQQLRAIPRDATGASLAGRSIQWSSGQPGVATVTVGGLVTAVGVGKTTISATSEGQTTGVDLTVAAAPGPPPGNAAADIAAVLNHFAEALESRQMTQVLRAFPDMSAQQQRRWTDLLESKDVTDFHVGVAQQLTPTIDDSAASVSFAITLDFRNPASGRVTQSVPYRATLLRTPAGWRLQSLQERR